MTAAVVFLLYLWALACTACILVTSLRWKDNPSTFFTVISTQRWYLAWQPLLWKQMIFYTYSWFPWCIPLVTLESLTHLQRVWSHAHTHTHTHTHMHTHMHTQSLDLSDVCRLRALEPTNVYFFNQIQLLLVWLVKQSYGKKERGAGMHYTRNDG